MKTHQKTEEECCPRFDPSLWEEKQFEWRNKRFIRDKVFTFLFIPLNFGQVMRRLDKIVTAAGATVPDNICLSEHSSKWKMNLLLAVDKEITGVENVTLNGHFFSKVYEGPFKDTAKWIADFSAAAQQHQLKIGRMFMWYTTCPKCAKKYGKNYVVIIAGVEKYSDH